MNAGEQEYRMENEALGRAWDSYVMSRGEQPAWDTDGPTDEVGEKPGGLYPRSQGGNTRVENASKGRAWSTARNAAGRSGKRRLK